MILDLMFPVASLFFLESTPFFPAIIFCRLPRNQIYCHRVNWKGNYPKDVTAFKLQFHLWLVILLIQRKKSRESSKIWTKRLIGIVVRSKQQAKQPLKDRSVKER